MDVLLIILSIGIDKRSFIKNGWIGETKILDRWGDTMNGDPGITADDELAEADFAEIDSSDQWSDYYTNSLSFNRIYSRRHRLFLLIPLTLIVLNISKRWFLSLIGTILDSLEIWLYS